MKKFWVIKTGGELWIQPSVARRLFIDIKNQSRTKNIVLVHGGGPQIGKALRRNRIGAHFVNGRRVTSPEGMIVVEQILSGALNKSICAGLNKAGVRAVGLSGRDGKLIEGKPLPKLGRAAKPVRVRPDLLRDLSKKGWVPVVSTVASDKTGGAVNINADDAASALAVSLRAARLIFLTDVKGVRGRNGKRMPILRKKDAAGLIRSGVISGGMIPKVQSALTALDKGVGEVDILLGKAGIDFRMGTRIRSKI